MVRALSLLLFVFLVLPQGLPSASQTATNTSNLLRLLETRYSSAHTLQTTFLERYLEDGCLVRMEAGNAYFLRPGKMRWDYEAPEKNTFLVDGKYVWFYSPADHTATRMPAKQSEDWRTPLAFLTSHMKFSQLCSQIELDKSGKEAAPGDAIFRCVLRGSAKSMNSTVRPVMFEVSAQGELKRIVVPEEGKRELEFSFGEWQWNPTLEQSVFEFVPPRGVAIVEGLLPDTPGLRQ